MIDIVIPHYGDNKLLERCLNSVISQIDEDDNIIVVNNSSPNLDISNIINKVPQVKVITLDKNYGFAKAVNEGIKLSKEKFVLLLNNDTVLKENFLKRIKILLEQSNDNIFSISTKMLCEKDTSKVDDAGDYYTILGWHYKRGNGLSREKFDNSYQIMSACAGAAVYNKKILEEIGFFDEEFFAYLEDVDLGLRAWLRGFINLFYPGAEVIHVGSATTGGKYNAFKVKLTARNSIYLIYKNIPTVIILMNFPFICAGFITKFIFFLWKGFGKYYIEGLLEGFITLHKFKSKRLENMKNRKISYLKIEGYLIKSTAILIYECFIRLTKIIVKKIFGK